jgi:oxygen-independent coproporphyrinogen-3 oxidase
MLRRIWTGIPRDEFRQRTGFELDQLAGAALERFRQEGCLEDDGRRVRLSRQGLMIADRVFCELL